jgi:DNA-binding NarL/FixJ family response regulator
MGVMVWQGVSMRAIPLPIRERIIHLYRQGKSTGDIAEFFELCASSSAIWFS